MAERKLTEADVERLMSNPSVDSRAETAAKLAIELDSGSFTEAERQVAEDIFRLMVRDAEVRVREALSHNLKKSINIPRDVAKALAQDVASVALPIIQFSEVLTDSDLIEIIQSQDVSKQIAVAGRSRVSLPVADALVETKNEDVVETLVGNHNADISEKSLRKVVDDFQNGDRIQGKMIYRKALPVAVMERLVTRLSEDLHKHLQERHDLPPEVSTELALQARERAILGLSREIKDQDVEDLVAQLRQNGRLTPSIVLRSLCMGDITFFEASMARLTHVPLHNARMVIHDVGPLGLKAICEKSGLPEQYFPFIRAAISLMSDIQYDGRPNDRARYSRLMMERILTMFDEQGVSLESDDMEYLLMKMGQIDLSENYKEQQAP